MLLPKLTSIIICLFIASSSLHSGDASTMDESEKTDTTGTSNNQSTNQSITFGNPWLTLRPLDSITFRSYYFDTNHPIQRYTLINSDGDRVDPGITMFTEFRGFGTLFDSISFSYRLQHRNADELSIKHATVTYSRWGVSIEYGIRNSWFGHGYYGSLLLSNHAPPYPTLKFQTERPVRIPYIGIIEYRIMNGWIDERFNILTHRITWFPFSWFEIGANQNIKYRPGIFKWYEFPLIMTAKYANPDTAFAHIDSRIAGNSHQQASFDFAIHLNSLDSFIYPVQSAGLYFEYAARDIFAYWQLEDDLWIGPFGFEFLHQASLGGVYIETEKEELRFEYAQTYRNIFYWSSYTARLYGKYTNFWYRRGYTHKDIILGHHMGRSADNLYVHFKRTDEKNYFKLYYAMIRRDLVPDWEPGEFPEIHRIYGLQAERTFGTFVVNATAEWHTYQNVDHDPRPLNFDIQPRTGAGQFLFGVSVRYVL